MPEKKKGVVPRLRFPEFCDAGPWEVKRLGEVVRHKSGNSKLIKGKLFSEPADNRFPGFSASGQDVWLNDFEYSGKAIIVSAVGAYCGRCFLADGKWSAIANTHILFPDTSRIDIRFLFNIVARGGFWIIGGSGQPFVKIRDSLKKYIPVPSLLEQQKIADCLSSLDEVIELEARKLEALKAHKKGLMQQLFPREGETVPRLRFPEFRDAGPWEVKRLGEVANIAMGASPKSSSYNNEQVGLPLLQGNADIKDRTSCPRLFTSQITRECHIGDILLSVRAPVGMVAKSVHHACIGRGIAAIRVKGENSQEFLYQWLLWFEPHWESISQGGTFDSVNRDDIRNLSAVFPKLPEQQKIADCLSSLDEVIDLEAKKLEALKAHKKGLMQRLFPQEVD